MSDTTFLVALIAVALLAALVGGTVTYIRMHRRLADLRERNASLTATLD
ncbi:MAG: hypothetical protein GWN84_26090, partial [Gammaproteobacteria bacterium]|nr:hypothetical protein [Gammaproteobacteria bacterium]NIR91271.1 hypothetical protein [Gammaproteobacteria bacterium]NIU07139.1 hypothetical protein [Gammaproteobacteria bacterium]NIV53952.1 hypothetical protein [Gammaproteobacteria bacterium]NIV76466.1 hypothetical protein [Gammaproteobacteria bacterium]